MGADFDFFITDKKTYQEVKSEFDKYCDYASHEDGHSYSGRLNMCPDLEFHDIRIFDSENDAEDYVSKTAQKWDNAIAVQFRDKDGLKWFIGGSCSC